MSWSVSAGGQKDGALENLRMQIASARGYADETGKKVEDAVVTAAEQVLAAYPAETSVSVYSSGHADEGGISTFSLSITANAPRPVAKSNTETSEAGTTTTSEPVTS